MEKAAADLEAATARKTVLKKTLSDWERNFASENDRKPSKEDKTLHQEAAYKEYNQCSKHIEQLIKVLEAADAKGSDDDGGGTLARAAALELHCVNDLLAVDHLAENHVGAVEPAADAASSQERMSTPRHDRAKKVAN